jgi:hypothetical protein
MKARGRPSRTVGKDKFKCMVLKFVDTGKPVATFSQPFSGHDWMCVPQWQQQAGQ